MECQLKGVGKQFNNHSIFSEVDFTFSAQKNYVILGGNGSGKSTLLKAIAGGIALSSGEISYTHNGNEINPEELPKYLGFCSPYMEVIEEFTFEELISFHKKFKPLKEGLTTNSIVEISGLKHIRNKPIRNFSSGMKQRVKLSLAVLSNCPLLLLDEPTSNLDPKGKLWYKELLSQYAADKTIIVASNFLEEEFPEHPVFLDLANYKH
jgi:ABC-type multidrug transport system ATPase subunit